MLKIFFVHFGVFYAVTYHFAPFEAAFRRNDEEFSVKYNVEFLFVESVCVPRFFDDGGKGFSRFPHFLVGNAVFTYVPQGVLVARYALRAFGVKISFERFERRYVRYAFFYYSESEHS